MGSSFSAPLAELFELYFPLHGFLILAGIVIPPFAHGALEPN